MSQCTFQDCKNSALTSGLCRSHYKQKLAGKTLKPLQVQYHGLTEYERFLKRLDIRGNAECWEWQGSVIKACWHGQWRNSSGKHELAHRAAWRLFKGPIPGGMFVLHKCDNPKCCNVAHLFLGTQSDNAKDMWAKDRARPKTNYGEKHGMAKVTEEIVREIRSSPLPSKELAKRYCISDTNVCDIRKFRTWKHVT